MPRTVSDEEWNFLQRKRQVADLVEPIYDDPQLSPRAKALLKEKYPHMKIDDYDLEQKFEARFEAERKAREEAETARRNEEAQERFQNTRKKVQDQYGFTPEGMDELEKFMVEKNVGDYDVAAEYLAAKKPKPIDAEYSDGRWNHSKAPGFAEIAADPEGWGRGEILKTLYSIQEKEKNQRF